MHRVCTTVFVRLRACVCYSALIYMCVKPTAIKHWGRRVCCSGTYAALCVSAALEHGIRLAKGGQRVYASLSLSLSIYIYIYMHVCVCVGGFVCRG